LMRGAMLALTRRMMSWARRMDRSGIRALRFVPTRWKRAVTRFGLRALAPLLPPAVEVSGVRFVAPRSHLGGYVLSPHEPSTVKVFERFLAAGSTAVDVGANIGYLSLQMARCVGGEGTVYAVEPAPENLVWLRRNVDLNAAHQIRILPVGAGAETSQRSMFLTGSTRNTFHPDPNATADSKTVSVPQVRLDDVIEGAIDLVKIDVEGSELEVLQGMQRILDENPRLCLIVEWNPGRLRAANVEPGSLPEYLAERGMRVFQIGDDGCLQDFEPSRVPDRRYVNLCALRDRAGIET